MLDLTHFKYAQDFLEVTGETLYQQEALNSLMIGLVERLVGAPHYYGEADPYLGVVSRDGKVILAGIMTPPFGLVLSPLSEGADAGMSFLVDGLLKKGLPLPDVNGVTPFSKQFADIWSARTGGIHELELAMRLYELRKVSPPGGVPGKFLQAAPEHLNLVAEWAQAFNLEALGTSPQPIEKVRQKESKRIAAGEWYLWQDGGKIVSMCLRTRPMKNGISIGGVYTPPELRRRGYATACVAALSQRLLDEGYSFTSLFTDLSNPTSNSIYMQIGYKPIADFEKYRLVS